VGKRQTRWVGFDEKVIALYAPGLWQDFGPACRILTLQIAAMTLADALARVADADGV
jgi:hypothetical protein